MTHQTFVAAPISQINELAETMYLPSSSKHFPPLIRSLLVSPCLGHLPSFAALISFCFTQAYSAFDSHCLLTVSLSCHQIRHISKQASYSPHRLHNL